MISGGLAALVAILVAVIYSRGRFNAVAWLSVTVRNVGRRERGLPPGPKTLPLIGNLHQIPTTRFAEYCSNLRKEFGGIISLKTGPGTIIILQDAKAVKELCDKKSSIYSSRPPSYIINELVVDHDHLLFLPYGRDWQRLAKLMKTQLSAEKCKKEHHSVQNAEALETVFQILTEPEGWYNHVKRFSTSVITTLVFGIRGPRYDFWAVKGIFAIMSRWSEIIELGATPPVDLLPFLKYLPTFLAPWKTWAKTLRKMMNGLYGNLFQMCIDRHREGSLQPCLAKTILDDKDHFRLTDHQASFFLGPLLEGGSETTAGTILSFVLAMIHAPQVQAKAQKLMDAVIGEDRSPDMDDWDQLEYVRQIQKEVLRWRPAITAGIPHLLTEDDTYEGYVLPKGSTVIINTLGLHMDPAKWQDPEIFRPERYESYKLSADQHANGSFENRDHHAYGAGRRFCHGVHLAERNLFLMMAKLLWAFEFSSPEGTTPDIDNYSTGLLSKPLPFPLVIKVRSEARAATIRKERAAAVDSIFSKFPEVQQPAWFEK